MQPVAEVIWPKSLIDQKLKSARMVGRVVCASPADKAGIQQDWLILSINGEAASDLIVSQAFVSEHTEIVFYDEKDERCFHIVGSSLPMGFDVIPLFTKEYGLDVRVLNVPADDWLKPWKIGELDKYPVLKRDFEVALSPISHSVFGKFVSETRKTSAMIRSEDRWSQLGLCLAYLAEENYEMAGCFVRAYFRNLQASRDDADLTIVLSAAYYALAAVSFHENDLELAKELIELSLENDPEAVPAQLLFRELFGKEFTPPSKEFLGRSFPGGNYALHQYDPYSIWPDPERLLTLNDAVSGLDKGTFGLVCVMGFYRSNGPFLEDLRRIIALQRSAEFCPKFVHVISAWKGAPDSEVSRMRMSEELQFKNSGLELQIGYDPDDEVSEAASVVRLPTWFVIGGDQTVANYGMLEDPCVIEAIVKHS